MAAIKRVLSFLFFLPQTAGLVIAMSSGAAFAAPDLIGFYSDDGVVGLETTDREERVREIAQNFSTEVESIVAYWSYSIDAAGGDVSQLRSTLMAADPYVILRVTDAVSIEEINFILLAQ